MHDEVGGSGQQGVQLTWEHLFPGLLVLMLLLSSSSSSHCVLALAALLGLGWWHC